MPPPSRESLERTTDALKGSAIRLPRRTLLGASLGLLAALPFARAAAASDLTSPEAANQTTEYVVQPGDTLSGIAASRGLDVASLTSLNGLANPNQLSIGQRLVLYAPDSSAPAPDVSADSSVPQAGVANAPYRSQFDGSAYAESNCGPATLGMFLGFFGESYSTADLRESVNQQMGNWSPNSGSTWESLVYAAKVRGFAQHGLYSTGSRYRAWSLSDLYAEFATGQPAMLMVLYRALPGKASAAYYGDHYILALGRNAQREIVYHDPASRVPNGSAYLTMSEQTLQRAWRTSVGINNTAMGLSRTS